MCEVLAEEIVELEAQIVKLDAEADKLAKLIVSRDDKIAELKAEIDCWESLTDSAQATSIKHMATMKSVADELEAEVTLSRITYCDEKYIFRDIQNAIKRLREQPPKKEPAKFAYCYDVSCCYELEHKPQPDRMDAGHWWLCPEHGLIHGDTVEWLTPEENEMRGKP